MLDIFPKYPIKPLLKTIEAYQCNMKLMKSNFCDFFGKSFKNEIIFVIKCSQYHR